MRTMYALAIVGASLVAAAAAQATSINPLINTDHKVKYCTVYGCLQAPAAPTPSN